MMLYVKTIGRILADVRHLGYSMKNILVAGPKHYMNRANLVHNGKSLEAGWHRATLDLLAAIALIDSGRFCGTILSYKSGHSLDVDLVRELYKRDLLETVR
jgi:UDP-3-O-acyl-N-acetylglucosamine deacetylase